MELVCLNLYFCQSYCNLRAQELKLHANPEKCMQRPEDLKVLLYLVECHHDTVDRHFKVTTGALTGASVARQQCL